jgi:hypothetical protein
MMDYSQTIFTQILNELVEIKTILKESSLSATDQGGTHAIPTGGTPEGNPIGGGKSEHHLSPFVEASLAYVVGILHNAWLDGPAKTWGAVHSVRPLAVTCLDKRVSATIREGFVCFSQLILNLKQLLLENRELGVVSEERILCLEKLVGNSGTLFGDESPITDGNSTASHVPCGIDGCNSN